MLANPRTFRCPNCKEMINDSMTQAITAITLRGNRSSVSQENLCRCAS